MFTFKKISAILQIVSVVLVFTMTSQGAAGDVDPSFTASAYGAANGQVYVLKKQADGKVLVGGRFTEIDGFAAVGLGRLNADGSVDKTLNTPNFFDEIGTGGTIEALGIQSDGKIIVGGRIRGFDGILYSGIVRLNINGSLDSTFQLVNLDSSAEVFDIEVLSDGKILVGGKLDNNSLSLDHLRRFNADGTIDNTFQRTSRNQVNDIEIQSDGKYLIAGSNYLHRLNADGSFDGSFSSVSGGGSIEAVKNYSNGKILIAGNFTTLNGFSAVRIGLVNSNGSLDLTFNQGNPGPNGPILDIIVENDGKILIAGSFTVYNTTNFSRIGRLNTNGTPDATFQNNPTLTSGILTDIEVLDNGLILAGNGVTNVSNALLWFGPTGILDTSLNTIVSRLGKVRRIVLQSDGKILIAGQFLYVNGVKRASLARLNTDGSLDTSFVPYFNDASPVPILDSLKIQPDGKILVGGAGIVLRRLNTDGSQDLGFTPPSFVSSRTYDIAVQDNGQIIIGGFYLPSGSSTQSRLIRLNSNGSQDIGYGGIQPNNTVYAIEKQSDGKIFIGGDFTQIGAALRGRIARLNTDSSVDTSFNPPGGANGPVYGIGLQTDGKVVLGGDFVGLNGSNDQVRIGRLNADGSLDTAFTQTINAIVVGLKIQADGKILIGGGMSVVQGTTKIGLARLNSNGLLDNSFNASAPLGVTSFDVQSDGKILVGGDFIKINGISSVRITRLQGDFVQTSTLFDYDGDGKADVSVFRPSTNVWYEIFSSNSSVGVQSFGVAGDIVAPADYDGDGKTDLGIFRPSTGDWWYLSSISNTQVSTHWGAAGDVPRPSDFDGDGKADLIVFRPGENNWYRLGSTGQVSITNFGLAGDKPVTGDFDGDGKSDLAIYRPTGGVWWYAASSLGGQFQAVQYGISTDTPVPADYDGDGKTDLAVYRASTGVWYILNSSSGTSTIVQFGLAEDKPVAADYDGDGKADIAQFRPSTGVWYLLRSSAGFASLQFGLSGDIPTQNSFVP